MADRPDPFKGNSYFRPFSPTSPPETPLRHPYQPLLPRVQSPEIPNQNPFQDSQDSHSLKTLESYFARLNVSRYNQPYASPIFDRGIGNGFVHNNSVNDYPIGDRTSVPLYSQEIEHTNKNELQGFRLQKNGFPTMVGPDSHSRGKFVHPILGTSEQSYDSNTFLNDLRTSLRPKVSSDFPIALRLDQNRQVNGFGLESQGVLSSSSSSSSYNRHPLWLQEPSKYRGMIVQLAMRLDGCQFLVRAIEGMNYVEIEMIFNEVISHVCDLMLHPHGNYVVQKLIEVCTEEQRTQIILRLTTTDFLLTSMCLNAHGSRTVKKLIDHLSTGEQIFKVMSALGPGTLALIKDEQGHHVIEHCVQTLSHKDNEFLLNVMVDNCFAISTNKTACCTLQKCMEFLNGEPRGRLAAEITKNASDLAEHPFGNYVVQHLLELKIPQFTTNILRQLEGRHASLSCNKYASHVVEKCLSESGEEQSTLVIMELLGSPNVSMLLIDPFGNYVIQMALQVSKRFKEGFIHASLLTVVQANYPMLRSNPYGKKVLSHLDKRGSYNMYRPRRIDVTGPSI